MLVVAEKNSVAKAIAKYLTQSRVHVRKFSKVKTYWFYRDGNLWVSIGLKGHLMEFDYEVKYSNWYAVEPEQLFKIKPILIIRNESLVYAKVLKYLGEKSRKVILALDADAEGEAIAFETLMILKNANPHITVERACFSAITKRELEKAFTYLQKPKAEIARRVFTRMELDLMLGAVFTRLLTLCLKHQGVTLSDGRFLSYGPCQTPVLNLVVKRAIERENFVPKKYYQLCVNVEIDGKTLRLYSKRIFENKFDALNILKELKSYQYGEVVKASYVKEKIVPPKPLDTLELERRASKFLNIRAKKTLDIAEELYRRGYISYPRTETTIYPSTLNLKEILYELLKTEHSGYAKYLLNQSILRPTQGDSYDGAHPPIHPVQAVSKTELIREFRDIRYWKIYDFIVRHFLATLSPPAIIERQNIEVRVDGVDFTVSGLRIVSYGYWTVYPYEKSSEKNLPKVSTGVLVKILNVNLEEKETEPPPYLTESELLRLMRRYGIGTDATMQDHIYTNVKRGYFKIRNKACIPTPLGKTVISIFSKYASILIDPNFRSLMERTLREVSDGTKRPEEVINYFKERAHELYRVLRIHVREIGRELASVFYER